MRETVWRRGRTVVFRGVYSEDMEPPQPPPHYERDGLKISDREYKLPRKRCPLCHKLASGNQCFGFEIGKKYYLAHYDCVVDVLDATMAR